MSDEWVVRGGISDAARLIAGYGRHMGHSTQQIYGFSVQFAPSLGVDELAQAGRFPNRQIAFARKRELEVALQPLGYSIELRKTKGTGYHHTLMVVYDATQTMLTVLPQDAAEVLSLTFQRKANPHPVTP